MTTSQREWATKTTVDGRKSKSAIQTCSNSTYQFASGEIDLSSSGNNCYGFLDMYSHKKLIHEKKRKVAPGELYNTHELKMERNVKI